MMNETDVVALALRTWLAFVMLRHGFHHARSLEGTAQWFASKGFRHAPLGLADRMDGWTGGAIGIGGVAAAALQLAATWRRPAPPSSTQGSSQ